MKRIIYFNYLDKASEHYRLRPLEYIENSDLTLVESTERDIKFDIVDTFDTIILYRPSGNHAVKLIKELKRWHKRVIIDWDDLPTQLDQYNPMFTTYEDDKNSIIECIQLADEAWVATEGIKKHIKFFNKNTFVIPNAHDDYIWPVSSKKPHVNNKIVTYRGSETHYGDIYEVGVPEKIIAMVNENMDWEFRFFGQRFHYLEKRCGTNYIAFTGGVPMYDFHQMMQTQNAQIFFYPLSVTNFNKGKSNCSWLESTYAGSAFFGNIDLPEFQKPGISSLTLLVAAIKNNSTDLTKENNEKSWEYIKSNLLVSKVNELRIERLLQ